MKFHVAIVAGLVLAGPAVAAPAQSSADRGLRLAERNCSVCHAIGARGESPNPKAPSFRLIYRRYPAETLDEAFRKGLLTRHPAMPEMRFLPREIVDLTAYFRTLRSRGEREARAATVQRAAFAH
ncbi:MAG TPA: cytochrome c [Caulobacteraceae bacterium]|jgi:mono/diheme cytochrome c family protein|nr:cytochrome c [Caulobacteraceae bacterium]